MSRLAKHVALVTGAGSGIGRAIALACAREGARVVASDRELGPASSTVAAIRAAGGDATAIACDVGEPAACRELVAATVAAYGRLDFACNNAGIGGELAPTADYPDEAWDAVIRVNLSGVFHGMKHQITQMLKQGGGSIVNIASILGQVGFANAPAYTAAKHGVVGLTKTAALEYSSRGIRINAIGPAFIRTPMIAPLEADEAANRMLVAQHPIGRLGEPEEVAELALWLATPAASFMTGAYLPVDGGYLAR